VFCSQNYVTRFVLSRMTAKPELAYIITVNTSVPRGTRPCLPYQWRSLLLLSSYVEATAQSQTTNRHRVLAVKRTICFTLATLEGVVCSCRLLFNIEAVSGCLSFPDCENNNKTTLSIPLSHCYRCGKRMLHRKQ
jgi:hypothetical protein